MMRLEAFFFISRFFSLINAVSLLIMKGKSRKELAAIMAELRKGPLEDRLTDYFDSEDFQDQPEIPVYELASEWRIDQKDMLDAFLHLTGLGFCDLQWFFHCPQCGGVAHESLSLVDAHEEDHCGICNVDFRNQLDQNVEVLFRLHEFPEKKLARLTQSRQEAMMKQIQSGQMVEWKGENTILGSHCIHHQQFREFLGEDLLDLTQTLAVSHSTLLFTDIQGSTALYDKLGDARAYRLVRDHFNILFHETAQNNGAVVKTIGDAVMSSFPHPLDGLKTALAMQRAILAFNKDLPADQAIEIKIGLHSGPALVVTLNKRLDYFGATVNKASRLQAEAHAGDIVISSDFFHRKEIQQELKKHVSKVMKRQAVLRGITGSTELYRIPRSS